MTDQPSDRLLWFGVLGGGAAWSVSFAINVLFTWAQCNSQPGRWNLPLHTIEVILSGGGALVGIAAAAVCLRIYRETYQIDNAAERERAGEGTAPPLGRVNFLATVGLLVNFLTVAIMIMTAISAPLLQVCQQS